jgi:large subunit ribosomal protein L32
MPVPKKKTSKSRRNMRRAHDFLTPKYAITCSNCGAFTLRHVACGECGFYRGRQVLKLRSLENTPLEDGSGE